MVVIKIFRFVFFYQHSISLMYSVYCISFSITISFFIYVYMYIHMHVCVCMYIDVYLYVCMYVCMYMYVYIYIIGIYIYIYKFTSGCHSQTTPSSKWRQPGARQPYNIWNFFLEYAVVRECFFPYDFAFLFYIIIFDKTYMPSSSMDERSRQSHFRIKETN